MDSRKEKIKNSLIISEYPWSSDDDEETDNNSPQGAEIHPLNLMRRQSGNLSDSPQRSIGDQPGTSGTRCDLPQLSSSPSDSPIRVTQSTLRKAQAMKDRHMFWSLLNNPTKVSISRSRLYDMPLSLSRMSSGGSSSSGGATGGASGSGGPGVSGQHTTQGVAGRLDRISSADIDRVLAFKRFTKKLNAIHAARTNNRVTCPVTRGVGAPSRNPLFNGGISKRFHPSQTSSRYVPSGSNSGVLQGYSHLTRQQNDNSRMRPNSDGTGTGEGQGEELTADRRCRMRHGANDEMPLNFCERQQRSENVAADRSEIEDGGMPSTSGVQLVAEVSSVSGRPQLEEMDVDVTVEEPSGTVCGAVLEEVVTMEDGTATSREVAPEGGPGTDSSTQQHMSLVPVANTGEDSTAGSQTSRGPKRKREGLHDSEPHTVTEFNQRLLRLLECPVCMDWMEAPIAQCRRGHLICTRCRERLTFCPVCRTTFSSVRNRAMEGVADLLRYPCRHGCGREVRIRRRARHEASCPARKYACPASLCAARAPLPHGELAHHFQNKHRDILKIGRKHEFSMKVNLEHHDSWLIMALHEYFHLRVDVDVRSWGVIIYVAYIGPQCKAKNFTYEITINGQYNSRKLVYARVTHSDLESSTLNVSRQDCFHLTLDQALNFLKFKNRHREQDRYLDFNVEITRCGSTDSGGDASDSE
ncbi:uncharacterized protein LOC131843673 [Achroia grisella]|uniref:uncharacterized protein LOC131843673 n=1 Tax=Achroia grisella TaxID=688607 RepID=UPI0027D2BA76|nr:uncharacterized protein LOC131843673 [Achroia grisella]